MAWPDWQPDSSIDRESLLPRQIHAPRLDHERGIRQIGNVYFLEESGISHCGGNVAGHFKTSPPGWHRGERMKRISFALPAEDHEIRPCFPARYQRRADNAKHGSIAAHAAFHQTGPGVATRRHNRDRFPELIGYLGSFYKAGPLHLRHPWRELFGKGIRVKKFRITWK